MQSVTLRTSGGSATTAGVIILLVLALVATFLVAQGVPALTAPADDLPYGPFLSFVLPLAFATVWAAFLALLPQQPLLELQQSFQFQSN